MDNPFSFTKISLHDHSWQGIQEWFLNTYFLAVESEIQNGAAKPWRRVDRSQRASLRVTFENMLSQEDKTFLMVSFDHERPMGYFLGLVKECIAEIPSKIGYINGLYIDPEYRRKHLATRLYEKGLEWFESQDIFHYELYVADQSHEARQFWSRQGFRLSEHVMNLSLKKEL